MRLDNRQSDRYHPSSRAAVQWPCTVATSRAMLQCWSLFVGWSLEQCTSETSDDDRGIVDGPVRQAACRTKSRIVCVYLQRESVSQRSLGFSVVVHSDTRRANSPLLGKSCVEWLMSLLCRVSNSSDVGCCGKGNTSRRLGDRWKISLLKTAL